MVVVDLCEGVAVLDAPCCWGARKGVTPSMERERRPTDRLSFIVFGWGRSDG